MNYHIDQEKISKIQALYQADLIAKKFFDFAATRERSSETTVRRVASHLSEGNRQVIKLFKKLEEIGLGTFVVGRHGAKSRFRWLFSLPSVGKVARMETKKLEEINPEPGPESESEDQADASDKEVITHSYQIRRDVAVRIALPYDLNEKEAERMAIWIRTLPL
jgi:hypothetical protein